MPFISPVLSFSSMEIVSQDGSRTEIKPGQTRELGRNQGLNSSGKTISRRHLLLSNYTLTDKSKETSLQFEVVGRNPIYVNKGNEVKIFRSFERGELGDGDMFCFSAKDPVWYSLREVESCSQSVQRNDLAGKLESDVGLSGFDDLGVGISDLDPVKEFGFVVIGHEFDSYLKKMIKDFKNWDWFLEEETGIYSEDEDHGVKRSAKRKRKKGEENDDEEWAGESDDDKELINKTKKAQKPSYTTRSKDRGKPNKDKSKNKGDTSKRESREIDEDVEDEDEDDETLGGFIVDDEGLEEEEVEDEVDDDDEEELDDDLDADDDE